MTSPFLVLVVSAVAGCIGAIVGIGGGTILIPFLTLAMGLDIRYAVGASLVSVIATSSGAAAVQIRDQLTHVRLAIFLELATTIGALAGVALSTILKSNVIFLIFSAVLLQSAYSILNSKDSWVSDGNVHKDPWAKRLKLEGQFYDPRLKKNVVFQVHNVIFGFFCMSVAGVLSGLLGIGSGALKVLAMDRAMKVPIKVSSATSNFMIGVTAAASASAYYFKGDILIELAAPVALGVLAGAAVGARLLTILPSKVIRRMFTVVLFVLSIQMAMRGLGYGQ